MISSARGMRETRSATALDLTALASADDGDRACEEAAAPSRAWRGCPGGHPTPSSRAARVAPPEPVKANDAAAPAPHQRRRRAPEDQHRAAAVALAHRKSAPAQATSKRGTAESRQPRGPRPRRPPQKGGRGEGAFAELLRRGLPVFRTETVFLPRPRRPPEAGPGVEGRLLQ